MTMNFCWMHPFIILKMLKKMSMLHICEDLIASDLTLLEAKSYLNSYTSYETITSGGPCANVSRCIYHPNCGNYRAIRLQKDDEKCFYEVTEGGDHSEGYGQPVGGRGLSFALYALVDPLIESGLTPMKIENALKKRLQAEGPNKDLALFAMMNADFSGKVACRARSLKKGAKVETLRELMGVLADCMVDLDGDSAAVKQTFKELSERNGPDSMICFKTFDVEVTPVHEDYVEGDEERPELTQIRTQGFVFSSENVTKNILSAIKCSPDGLSLALDGTYKLLFNGWVLIVLSSHTVNYTLNNNVNGRKESHSAIPFLFCLVRSEAQPAFDCLLTCLTLVSNFLFINN